MPTIENQIKANLRTLAKTSAFAKWYKIENSKKESGLVIVNNSFFFRKNLETTKNQNFLCLKVGDNGDIDTAQIAIASGLPINSDYKFIPSRSKNSVVVKPVSQAIEDELASLGKLLFVLIGKIDDSVKHTATVNHKLFSTLTLNPQVSKKVSINHKEIVLCDLFDEEELWNELTRQAVEAGLIKDNLPDDFLTPFSSALESLTKKSYSTLILPDGKRKIVTETLIDKIRGSLERQVAEYKASLRKSNGDGGKSPTEHNTILRIAYVFASDATNLLRLITSICDIKPIVFWLTLQAQLEVSESFKNLPWKRSVNKPNLESYEKAIRGARNKAFHNVFPFTKSLEVRLDNVNLKARSLRLFSAYNPKKTGNVLDYEDKELVEIFGKFTRSEERYVSPEFWRKNLIVMEKTIDLLAALSEALKTLAAAVM